MIPISFAHPILIATAAAALMLLCGCDSRSDRDLARLEGERLSAELMRRVDAIVARSNELTTEAEYRQPDGTKVSWRKRIRRHVNLPVGTWVPPEGFFPPATDSPTMVFEPEEAPLAIVIDNAGIPVISTMNGVFIPGDDGNVALSEFPATVLQWNAEGDRLLVSGPASKSILAWPSRELMANLNDHALQGYLQFAPRGNELWLMQDSVDLAASSSDRIFWGVWEVAPDESGRRLLTPGAIQVSLIGTLPSAGIAWASPAQDYRIFPDPAPLYTLNEDFSLGRRLTNPGESIDIRPTADASGRFYYIRMSRYIESESGNLMGATARAWTVDSEGSEQLISAEPTISVSVSPNGAHVALLVAREGNAALITRPADQLLAQDLSEYQEAQAEFEQKMRTVADELRAALAQTDIGKTLVQTPFGLDAVLPPDHETLEFMKNALRDSLIKNLDVTLGDDFTALGTIDGLLVHGDGYWEEEPATVLALAGLYGSVMDALPETDWRIEEARATMSADLTTDTMRGDELYFTLHSPFYVARERLAGRSELDTTARRILEEAHTPLLLTENVGDAAVESYLAEQALLAGIETIPADAATLHDAVLKFGDNDVVNQLVYFLATEAEEHAIAIVAGMNLATDNPSNADALVKAAKALQAINEGPAALKLYRQAEKLAPQNAQVLFDVGLGYFDEAMLPEAKALFLRARMHDNTKQLEVFISENLRQIELLLDEEEATAQ